MTTAADTIMFAEAASAYAGVERQLRSNAARIADIVQSLRAKPPTMVVTCARGSSDHAATFAKYLFETRLGWVTASAAPSVSSIYHAPLALEGALFVALSQSGRSPDLLAALDQAGKSGARTLAIVNDEASPLASMAQFTLPLHAGPELSVAATKSFIGTLFALLWLCTALEGSDPAVLELAPAKLREAWQLDWSALSDRLAARENAFILGRGPALGIAQEAALKLKETCGLHAEAFSTAEVRHGPMRLAAQGMPMLVFRSPDAAAAEVDAFVAHADALGVDMLVTGRELPILDAPPPLAPILQVQSFYRAVEALARARGQNPDQPPLLAKVTATV